MYIGIFICMYICLYANEDVCIYLYIYFCMYEYMHVCLFAQLNVYINLCTYMYICFRLPPAVFRYRWTAFWVIMSFLSVSSALVSSPGAGRQDKTVEVEESVTSVGVGTLVLAAALIRFSCGCVCCRRSALSFAAAPLFSDRSKFEALPITPNNAFNKPLSVFRRADCRRSD